MLENIKTILRMLNNYGRRSVFAKGFAVTWVCIFLVLSIITGGIYLFVCETDDDKKAENLSTEFYRARNSIESVNRLVDESCLTLKSDSEFGAAIEAGEDGRAYAAQRLDEVCKSAGFISSIYLYIPNSDYIISTSNIYKSDNKDNFVDMGWNVGLKNGENFFYREYPDIGIISKCFSYCIGFETEHGTDAELIFNVSYSKMNLDKKIFEENSFCLVDGNNKIVYSPKTEAIGKDISYIISDTPEKSADVYVREFSNLKKRLLQVKMKRNNMSLVVCFAKKWTYGVSVWLVLLIAMLAVCVSAFLALLITAKMYEPIAKIIKMDSNLENYGFGGGDEINNTIEYIAEITRHNKMIERELAQNILLLQSAQVSALQSQLNPHFLFNTMQLLNSYILAEFKHDTEATKIILLISELLREAMDINEFFRTLEREIEFSEKYIEIQKLRYPNKFEIEWKIAPETLDIHVPKCIIQPLLENAVSYGVLRAGGKGKICVESRIEDSGLKISVRDNGPGFTEGTLKKIREAMENAKLKPRENLGLWNVNQRIRTLFGNEYRLELRSENGAEIIITVPVNKQ